MKSQEQQQIQAQVEEVRGRLQSLAVDLQAIDAEVEDLSPQRSTHQLLEQACSSLEELEKLGASSLFWGERTQPVQVAEQLRDVRRRVSAFQEQLGELDDRRSSILEKVSSEEEVLEILGEDLYDIHQQEERRKQEWIVEREITPLPRRVQVMAWARGGEDDARFRKTLAASLLVSGLFGLLLPMIDLPLPKRFVPDEMPKRLAQLVRQEQAKLMPRKPVVPDLPPEQTPPEEAKPDPVEQQQPTEEPPDPVYAEADIPSEESRASERPTQDAPAFATADLPPHKAVQKAGILAFRDKFASLAQDKTAPRLGADARYSDADDVSRASSRNMLTSNAPGASGGINVDSLSRNVGGRGGGDGDGDGAGGGGGGIHGVPVGRATSSIDSIGGGARPRAGGGPGLARTDEEIQIVFDRYKASFYRLYNRELRNDPTLRGQMVLQLTIEPDGSVSMCKLQSSDMNAPALAEQVVSRVKTINFGAKDVKALTIVYPIDFLPAA